MYYNNDNDVNVVFKNPELVLFERWRMWLGGPLTVVLAAITTLAVRYTVPKYSTAPIDIGGWVVLLVGLGVLAGSYILCVKTVGNIYRLSNRIMFSLLLASPIVWWLVENALIKPHLIVLIACEAVIAGIVYIALSYVRYKRLAVKTINATLTIVLSMIAIYFFLIVSSLLLYYAGLIGGDLVVSLTLPRLGT